MMFWLSDTVSTLQQVYLSVSSLCDNIWSPSVPQYGMTACKWASVRGHTDVVQLFLSSGTQVDLQDEVSTTSPPISGTTF